MLFRLIDVDVRGNCGRFHFDYGIVLELYQLEESAPISFRLMLYQI